MTQQPIVDVPVEHVGRKGFLPIKTNTFDRGFISVLIFVAIHLLYMRFVEPMGAPIEIATILCLVIAVIVVRKG